MWQLLITMTSCKSLKTLPRNITWTSTKRNWTPFSHRKSINNNRRLLLALKWLLVTLLLIPQWISKILYTGKIKHRSNLHSRPPKIGCPFNSNSKHLPLYLRNRISSCNRGKIGLTPCLNNPILGSEIIQMMILPGVIQLPLTIF